MSESYETSLIDWCEFAVLMKLGLYSVCDCCSFCVEEILLVWNEISLEKENVHSSHSNVFMVWGENVYSLLYSGSNLFGCRCVQYAPTRLCGLWNFGRIESVSKKGFSDVVRGKLSR
jgi:hypothetical protein